MIRIELYSERSLPNLTVLLNQWDPDTQFTQADVKAQLDMIFFHSNNQIFIAVNEDVKAVGYAITGICYYLAFQPFVEVIQLMVDERHRSQKIRKCFIATVCEHYKAMGINEIKLHSQLHRTRAHHFYKSLGFRSINGQYFMRKRYKN